MSNFSFTVSVYIILSLMLTKGLNTESQQLNHFGRRWIREMEKNKQTRMQKTVSVPSGTQGCWTFSEFTILTYPSSDTRVALNQSHCPAGTISLSPSLSLLHTHTHTSAQSFTMQADWPYSAQGCECWPPTPEHKQESSYKDGLSKGCLWHRMPNKSTVNRQRTHGSTALSSPQWAAAADCADTS